MASSRYSFIKSEDAKVALGLLSTSTLGDAGGIVYDQWNKEVLAVCPSWASAEWIKDTLNAANEPEDTDD